jgi:hypothetical protein
VRPIIRCASLPTAYTSPTRSSIATTDGSDSTIPSPRTYTTVFAVPRSMAMSPTDPLPDSSGRQRRARPSNAMPPGLQTSTRALRNRDQQPRQSRIACGPDESA